MNRHSLQLLLDTYGELASDLPALPAEVRAELASLAHVHHLLQSSLTPIQPRSLFREELRRSLLAEVWLRQNQQESRDWGPLRRHWKLTAAATASGISMAVGAITFVAWYRARSDA